MLVVVEDISTIRVTPSAQLNLLGVETVNKGHSLAAQRDEWL